MTKSYVTLLTAAGNLEAEIWRGLLEAQGLRVQLRQESAGAAYGLAVGPLGEVEVLVAVEDEAQARLLVDDYYAGKLDTPDE
jgi:hypothetical protein